MWCACAADFNIVVYPVQAHTTLLPGHPVQAHLTFTTITAQKKCLDFLVKSLKRFRVRPTNFGNNQQGIQTLPTLVDPTMFDVVLKCWARLHGPLQWGKGGIQGRFLVQFIDDLFKRALHI